jgi:hypothetical protein
MENIHETPHAKSLPEIVPSACLTPWNAIGDVMVRSNTHNPNGSTISIKTALIGRKKRATISSEEILSRDRLSGSGFIFSFEFLWSLTRCIAPPVNSWNDKYTRTSAPANFSGPKLQKRFY